MSLLLQSVLIVVMTTITTTSNSPFSVTDEEMARALNDPQFSLKLYGRYKDHFLLHPTLQSNNGGTGANDSGGLTNEQRFKLFMEGLDYILSLNKRYPWKSGLNQFTSMTAAEKKQYLGVNVSAIDDTGVKIDDGSFAESSGRQKRSVSVDWRSEGKVTGVKNQGKCGACWAFAAAGALETSYALLVERRKQFSEQELVDCTYDESFMGKRDPSKVLANSCDGGFYHMAWYYMKETGRLATTPKAPYKQGDGACDYSSVHNGLISARVNNIFKIKNGEPGIIRVLNSRAIAVGFEVTNVFQSYQSGIIRDTTCVGDINHAVVAVGYTPRAIIGKNSWGRSWGEEGYFRVARFHHGCQIYDYPYYIVLNGTGKPDNDPEYVPDDGGDDCIDFGPDGCPCGTVRCSDGVCRHEHMC